MLKQNTITNEFLTKFNSIMRIDPSERVYTKDLYLLDEFHQATEQRLLQKKEIRKQERKNNVKFIIEYLFYIIAIIMTILSYIILHSMFYFE